MRSNTAEIATSDETRLAELVWRMLKLRLLILAGTLVAILITWSTLEAGFAKALQHDLTFIEQQVELLKGLGIKPEALFPAPTQLSAQMLIAVERRLLPLIAPVTAADKAQNRDAFYQGATAALEAYDRKRREAFLVEISLPYLKTSVAVNALTIADVWPVCTLVILVILAILGFQQTCYEVILTSCVETRGGSDRAKALALSGFFAGRLRERKERGTSIWLYEKPWMVLPFSLILNSLVAAVILLSLAMLAAYDPTAGHPTRSIIFSYYSLTWCLVVLASTAVWLARKYYAQRLAEALGGRVASSRMFSFHARVRGIVVGLINAFSGVQRIVGIVSIAGLSTLAMTWMQPQAIHGYTFLWRQKPLSVTSAADPQVIFFPVAPEIFHEMQLHVIVACSFLVMSLVWSRTRRRGRLTRALEMARQYVAYVLLFAAGNFFFYLLVLLYQAKLTDMAEPIMDILLNPSGALNAPRGLPLLFYSPTVAFWIFCVCNLALVAEVIERSIRRRVPTT